MRKIKIAVFILGFLIGCLIFAAGAEAADQDSWEWSSKKTYKYMLESQEFDVKVIEWTPKDNPNIRCMVIIGSGKRFEAVCYPVSRRKKL